MVLERLAQLAQKPLLSSASTVVTAWLSSVRWPFVSASALREAAAQNPATVIGLVVQSSAKEELAKRVGEPSATTAKRGEPRRYLLQPSAAREDPFAQRTLRRTVDEYN